MALTKIGATLGGSADVITVTQSSHGLLLGRPVKMTSSGYAHATADTAANAEAVGIVIASDWDGSSGANTTFTLALSGRITVDGCVPNLTAGTVLFLQVSAGLLAAAEPDGNNQVSKPMAVITVANSEMIMVQQRGEVVSTGAATIADDSITNAKLTNMAANTVKVRDANSSGDPSDKAVADTQILIGDGTGFTAAALSGDVTMANTGAVTIATDAVDIAMLSATGSAGSGTFLRGDNQWAAAGASAPLQLASGSAGTPTYSFSSDTDTGIFMVSAGTIGFAVGSNEKMRLNSNGGLFINETTHANTGGGCIVSKAGNNNDAQFVLKGSGTTIDHGMTTLPNQNTDCEVDDYLIMQANHNLKGGVYTLALAEDTTPTWVLETITRGQDTSRSTSTSGFVQWNLRMHDGSNGNDSSSMSSEAAGFVIKRDGSTQYIFNMSATAYADTGWSTFSDGRLKLNQAEVPYGLATVMQMQPKIYDKHSGSFDDDGKVVLSETKQRMLGFVAQEVKALAPELVADINEDDSFYGLDNGRIVPILVKAIQELNAKVEALGS